MATMYDDYSFEVTPVAPSGLLSYQSGHASTSRRFLVPCMNAEEFALRQIGKFYDFEGSGGIIPKLPAPFPFDGTENAVLGYGRLNMIAMGFTIEPVSGACFNVDNGSGGTTISNPTSITQMEKYWHSGEGADQECCECIVTITYEENPCDCVYFDSNTNLWHPHDDILPHTCISVERNPAYEAFTLPNTNLVWANLPAGPDRSLKQDSYAYQIIPKADIIVHWHNVPVYALCKIETYLTGFRGCVNDGDWGGVLLCDEEASESDEVGVLKCRDYESETIMFVDWQEDRSRRTDAFGGVGHYAAGSLVSSFDMNTTTLKLVFKQKRVVDQFTQNVVGWNHLFLDRADDNPANDAWERVKIDKGSGVEENLFTLKDFSLIFYPPNT